MSSKPKPLRERAAVSVRRREMHVLMRMYAGDRKPQPRAFMRECENLWLEGYRAGLRTGRAGTNHPS
jgi:hypothetical protein